MRQRKPASNTGDDWPSYGDVIADMISPGWGDSNRDKPYARPVVVSDFGVDPFDQVAREQRAPLGSSFRMSNMGSRMFVAGRHKF